MNRSRRATSATEPASIRLEKVVSGGQTGVDRAALDVARALGVPCGGWCPKGRRAEGGAIHHRYPLRETVGTAYSERTIRNIVDSDGTLILAQVRLTGGTLLTKNTAQKKGKPFLVVDLDDSPDPEAVKCWLEANEIRVLNVAGPRASQAPRIYEKATRFLLRLLSPVPKGDRSSMVSTSARIAKRRISLGNKRLSLRTKRKG